jgi:DNA-binding response OmpR family regulator
MEDCIMPLEGDANVSSPAHSRPRILLITPFTEDHSFYSSIFQLPYWKAYRARSYREAVAWLMRDRMTVIICESHLPDGDWKDILSQAQVLPDPPYLVVASRLADDLLWAEVLNLGGYDLLAKPFVRDEVIRVAELASRNWSRDAEDAASAAAPPRKAPQQEVSPRTEEPSDAAARARAARISGGS